MYPANPFMGSQHPGNQLSAAAATLMASSAAVGSGYSPGILSRLQLSNLLRQDPALGGGSHLQQQQQHTAALHHAAAAQHAAQQQQQHAAAMHLPPGGYGDHARFAALSGLPTGPLALDPMMQLLASLQHGGPNISHQPSKLLNLPPLQPPPPMTHPSVLMTHPAFRLSAQSLLASLQQSSGQQQQQMAAAAAYGSMPMSFGKMALGLAAAGSAPAAAAGVPASVNNGRSIMTAQRLAALAKYMEKRKHRKFHKKVRYESRKRLAESRPRVRGQFVKQEVHHAAPAPAPTPAAPSTQAPGSPDTPATPSPAASDPTSASVSVSPGNPSSGPAIPGPASTGGVPGVPANLSPAGAAVAAVALSNFLKNISRLSALPPAGCGGAATTTAQQQPHAAAAAAASQPQGAAAAAATPAPQATAVAALPPGQAAAAGAALAGATRGGVQQRWTRRRVVPVMRRKMKSRTPGTGTRRTRRRRELHTCTPVRGTGVPQPASSMHGWCPTR
ncbi:MAG: hypothetical protein WDW38_011452 [Sanguina aurantia]